MSAWPSRGGVVILNDCEGVDFDFLGPKVRWLSMRESYWIARFDKTRARVVEWEKLLPHDMRFGASRMARTMNERCDLLGTGFGAKFYRRSRPLRSMECLQSMGTQVQGRGGGRVYSHLRRWRSGSASTIGHEGQYLRIKL